MERPANVRQLPRGRHQLSREEVLSSQRGRMLEAIGNAVAELGYLGTSVTEIIKRAGVSRETFYEHFSNKEDCFLAAMDTGVEAMLSTLASAIADLADDPIQRFDRALRAYLDALAAEPAFARVYLVEAYAAGQAAVTRRVTLQERFVDAVIEIFGARTKADRFACEALVSAVSSLVTMRVGAGRADELPQLRRPIMELIGRATPSLFGTPQTAPGRTG